MFPSAIIVFISYVFWRVNACEQDDSVCEFSPGSDRVSLLQRPLSVEVQEIQVKGVEHPAHSTNVHFEKPNHDAAHNVGRESHHGRHHSGPDGINLSVFLVATIVSLMVVFFFANAQHLSTRVTTWKVLSTTASIFAAILLYGNLKHLVKTLMMPTSFELTAITLSFFGITFVASHAVLYRMSTGDKMQLQAAATIHSHLCGFAAMYGFADCQKIQTVEGFGAGGQVVLILASFGIILGLSYSMDRIMKRVVKDDGTLDESEKEWVEICNESDDDVLCLAVSFLTVQFFCTLMHGHFVPYEPGPGHLDGVTQYHANLMLLCSSGFGLLVLLGAVVMHKFSEASLKIRRLAANVQHINSMIMAWSALFWAEWQLHCFGWEKTVVGCCVAIAIFMTMISFLQIFVLDHIGALLRDLTVLGDLRVHWLMRRAKKSSNLALGILIGFSWERAFHAALEVIEHHLVGHTVHRVHSCVLVSMLSLALFAVVFPAWRYHILPKAVQLEEEDVKT